MRVLGQLLEHEPDGERSFSIRRERAADRVLVAEVMLRHAAADRDRARRCERCVRIAIDDLVGEHVEDVGVGDVDVLPIRLLVVVA